MADVVGLLRAAEVRDSYASVSLEELMDQHIDSLVGNKNPLHPSALVRLTKIRDAFMANLEQIKEMPPENFRRPSPSDDVNTSDEA